MSSHKNLIPGSIIFAVFWTAGMLWWMSPTETAGFVSTAVAGAVAGVLWYGGMRLWMSRAARYRYHGA